MVEVGVRVFVAAGVGVLSGITVLAGIFPQDERSQRKIMENESRTDFFFTNVHL
jgi:hypothetical protein